jgi:hypothetical protein
VNKNGKAWSWVLGMVAAAATTASIGLLLWALSLRQQVEVLQAEAPQSLQQAKVLEQEMRRPAVPAEESSGLAGAPAEPGTLDTAGSPDSGAALLEGIRQLFASQEAPDPDRQKKNPFLEMLEGIPTTEADAASMVESEYADLFELLALPEKDQQRVRDILRDYTLRTFGGFSGIANMMELNEEDLMKRMGSMMEQQEKAESDLRKQLSAVLTPAGMAIFDEYEATSPERRARADADMDLAMNASGMTGEVRSMLLDVLVEEQLAQDEAEFDDERLEMTYTQQKMLVLQRGRERLSTVLDEQQLAEVDRFVERQRRWLEKIDEKDLDIALPRERLEGAP